MLERTAGWLETGSLRRLLPRSKKSSKNSRKLHSGFWTHGAGVTEFSPLWTALVRAAEPAESQEGMQGQQRATQNGVLFHFLYPAGALNVIRQYAIFGWDNSDGRWASNGLGRLGQRSYTSSAQCLTTTDEDSARPGDVGTFRKLLGLQEIYDYEEAWRQYKLLEDGMQDHFRVQLLEYLSTSERITDAERTTELFGLLAKADKSAEAHRCAIRGFLIQRDLSKAVDLQKMAMEELGALVGAKEVIAYLVRNSFYTRAFSFWKEVQQLLDRTPQHYNIYEELERDQNLGGLALQVAEYVDRMAGVHFEAMGSVSDESSREEKQLEHTRLKEFGSQVARRALLSTETFKPPTFEALLQKLQSWRLDTPALYEELTQLLTHLQQTKLAVKCYRRARGRDTAKFTHRTLHSLLRIFCRHHSILGMQQVLDDFFTLHSGPTRTAYMLCMSEFARQGDSQTAHALFNQYTTRAVKRGLNPIWTPDDIAPLLHVHAVRGEIREVVDLFDQLEDLYKLEPNLLCWNILISAYAKVHDVESAYACFEKVLENSELKADDYTFGTMMGMCITHGDLDRAIDFYLLAEEMKIETSTAMIDCLVLGHIREDDLQQAEQICQDCMAIRLKGNRTRMWNYILNAYAMRRDLPSVNRTLQRMTKLKIEYDEYTYSALMQALAMVGQPDRARAILQEVMPKAGVQATSFHWAVVMGGYIANGETWKVFHLQNHMNRRKLRRTASTNLMALRAKVADDEELLRGGTQTQVAGRAMEMFEDIVRSMNPQEISGTPRKGGANLPLDRAYSSMFYGYMMHVVSKRPGYSQDHVESLYKKWTALLPDSADEDRPPLQMLVGMMKSRYATRDHEGLEELWGLAVSLAKERGQPLPPIVSSEMIKVLRPSDAATNDPERSEYSRNILRPRQLDLTQHLKVYMQSLAAQGKHTAMIDSVNDYIADGFVLDNTTWNAYVCYLARGKRYKLAFNLCEQQLMKGWANWPQVRWFLPIRNKLPLMDRAVRKSNPRFQRPLHKTLVWLAKCYLDLQSISAESESTGRVLRDIERGCPETMRAIKTMERTDEGMERRILGSVGPSSI